MTSTKSKDSNFDAIVIGSGFGGAMAAKKLVEAGKRVLMIERGDWVSRGMHNWSADASIDLTPYYSMESPYRVLAGGNNDVMGAYNCVGGPSVFYGAVSMRLREADFEPEAVIVADSGAKWPYEYQTLEPFYTQAEEILGIAGEADQDPTEPPRSKPYPNRLSTLSQVSRKIQKAAERLALRPFRLPLAINYGSGNGQASCVACTTCDTFACAIEAKNDIATRVLPKLLEMGMELIPKTVAVRLKLRGRKVDAVECVAKESNEQLTYRANTFVLSAGALASPHLLLASGLARQNPGGHTVGRYLTRHCNAIAFGIFRKRPDRKGEFHKQLGIHDFYFGHPSISKPSGKLGSMQQLQTPPVGLVHGMLPKPLGHLVGLGVPHLTGLLVMAEDQPQYDNHVAVNWGTQDRFGLPQLLVTHRYSKRDYAARDALLAKAREVLKTAGALFCYIHHIMTFSHAVGTVRMGEDEKSSALDPYCQFRGLDNLFVVDGSFMPTSGGLNPSLTISANALRVGEYLAGNLH